MMSASSQSPVGVSWPRLGVDGVRGLPNVGVAARKSPMVQWHARLAAPEEGHQMRPRLGNRATVSTAAPRRVAPPERSAT